MGLAYTRSYSQYKLYIKYRHSSGSSYIQFKDGGEKSCRIFFFQVKQWMMLQEIILLYMGVLSSNHCR